MSGPVPQAQIPRIHGSTTFDEASEDGRAIALAQRQGGFEIGAV